MKILVVNAGSSSIKYQLIDMTNESVIAKGQVERINIPGSKLTHDFGGKEKFVLETPIKDHTEGLNLILEALVDKEHGVIGSIDEIGAVGHRVLHGGESFTKSCIIDEKVEAAIEENIPLGPLHNPANLMGIHACQKVMPNTPQVAVFDTAFHQTMPDYAYMYGVPKEYYKKYHIRRYGFHGTSHRFVSARANELLKKEHSRIVICHLGNGSSLSAVVDGKCVDTTMGLTPLEGVMMGTRSGSLDSAVVECIANRDGISVSDALNILNKKSGLLGISGISSDMRDVSNGADEGNPDCVLALNMWAYGIRKFIGAFAAAMGGIDALVFTAGIGENDWKNRAKIVKGLEFLGIEIDEAKNEGCREERVISKDTSKVTVMVIPTNEELAIARDTLGLVTGK